MNRLRKAKGKRNKGIETRVVYLHSLMRFNTNGIVLWVKPLEENGAMIHCVTEDKGFISGFVKALVSKKSQSSVSVGSLIAINYYGKERSSGKIVPDCIRSYIGSCMDNKIAFFLIMCTCELAHFLWGKHHGTGEPSRDDKHANAVFRNMQIFFQQCCACKSKELECFIVGQFVIVMKALLTEAGYGFSLLSCVATGEANIEELTFISPKSASAVSKNAAANYPNKFLPMPRFFITNEVDEAISKKDIMDAMLILDTFLSKVSVNYISERLPKIWEDVLMMVQNIA